MMHVVSTYLVRGKLGRLVSSALLISASSGAIAIREAVVRPATAEASTVSAEPSIRLVVDRGAKKMYVITGKDTTTYSVAVGQPSYPTPPGSYQISHIVWNPKWIPPDDKWAKGKKPQPPGAEANPMKLVKMFFREPAYYIHGTNDPESIGYALSHGCIRMDADDAYQVARTLMEHGGDPQDESWFWRVLHFRSETKDVYLGHPVPLAIVD